MHARHFIARGLTYYWRTNLAVVIGVATAVAVLAGALLVGDSVRGSLRDLVLQRLGRTDHVVASVGFFRAALADDLAGAPVFRQTFQGATPLVIVPGVVTEQESGRRVGGVRVYGVDERFWAFHGVAAIGPADREALLSPALARELNAQLDRAVLVRVQRPSDFPLESVQGRKEDLGRTLRLTVRAVVPSSAMGEFSLEAQQADVRAVFVPLAQLQAELEVGDRVNTILVSNVGAPPGETTTVLERLVRGHASLDDLGLTLRTLDALGVLALGSRAGVLTDPQVAVGVDAGARAAMGVVPVLTYLANTIRRGEFEVPYSLVTAIDLETIAPGLATPAGDGQPGIALNEWAAEELEADVGDRLTLEYYLWEEPGRLVTRTTEFRVSGVVPVTAGDRDLVPDYPGITDSPSLVDWDPPFPIDLRRIRPSDEAYWERYRTTPKAFVTLEAGQRMWRSRHGAVTSLRFAPPAGQTLEQARADYAARLREVADPAAMGVVVRDAKANGLAASRGATDFGAYFVYFSFFLVVSALLLAALFFKLGVEQRVREVGLLRALGFGPARVRRLFMIEGLLLAGAGSAVGVLAAVGYAALLMQGLGSWWIDAVGTDALTLHVSTTSLLAGAAGGISTSAACIWWTLRGLSQVSERSLLTGRLEVIAAGLPGEARSVTDVRRAGAAKRTRLAIAAGAFGLVGFLLLVGSTLGVASRTGAFFGAGTALLIAVLCLFAVAFRRLPAHALAGHGWAAVSRLGARSTTYRPGRSVLSVAVIAAATFILISVDAFRRDGSVSASERQSGVGGYALLVETLLPVVHDPNTREGRDALNLFDLDAVTFEPFRVLPGDDASCLNLYEPTNPRILAPRDSFLAAGRFAFQGSLASTDEERRNPWLLLQRAEPDGAVPVVADANSMTYVLHKQLGDEMVVTHGGREIRLRFVASLLDSIFQGELLMSQANFLESFPDREGYQVLLVDTDPTRASAVADVIENALVDFGADAVATGDRLAEFHRVEHTYLSTFQTLGGLGLLLGTVGLGAVLLRNALERRRELALLQAVGYRHRHFLLMVAAENTILLAGGVVAGAACAALAIAPAVAERGGRVPLTSGGALLLFAVLAVGLLSSLVATRAAVKGPLLESLRSE
jgi:ABC-type lipoprotein release transport system permease subunit